MTQFSINEFRAEAPFADLGVTSDDYVPLDAILDTNIEITAVTPFTNDKGEGVYILAKDDQGNRFYLCTHSIGITAVLTKEKLLTALELGDTITCKIVRRKSQNSDRMVYAFA